MTLLNYYILMHIYIYMCVCIKYEWNENMKISFQGLAPNHPVLHHNFHLKRHQGQCNYHFSQQFTHVCIELPWFDAYLWYNVRLDRKNL